MMKWITRNSICKRNITHLGFSCLSEKIVSAYILLYPGKLKNMCMSEAPCEIGEIERVIFHGMRRKGNILMSVIRGTGKWQSGVAGWLADH